MATPTLDQIALRKILRYDPNTGHFTWLVQPNGRCLLGSRAGTRKPSGGYEIKIEGKLYQASRLAFLWMVGRWPAKFVDHANRDRGDNRWVNLREADRSQNAANQRKRRGRELPKGVECKNGRYYARIKVNQRLISLGGYSTIEDARQAYLCAAREHFKEFALGG